MSLLTFLKNWTLPVAIAVGSVCYLTFLWVPALDQLGDRLGAIINVIFPMAVFSTLFVTFCKVDFHQMRPHRWHVGVLVAQLVLVAANVAVILWCRDNAMQKTLWEAVLTCVIAPSAAAAPVVTGKLGGNISTMSAFTVISSFASALMIPFVFPLLEQTAHVSFWAAFLIILEKVALVLVLPLVLGWSVQHLGPFVKPVGRFHKSIVSMPNLSFYCWAFSLSITSGITVKNIVHSGASAILLMAIALLTLLLCFVQFGVGRGIGHRLGEHINSGQALFQKNTALAIWVAYMYLNPVASVGAGCYVLWQNLINSMELWAYRKGHPAG
ncbi:MAG: transporter [Prevotella sp.]|nr:transporter [Prevotella sp.]